MPINPSVEFNYVKYRPGGPGNNWKILDTEGEMTAPSGGGISVESQFGRGPDGTRRYIGLNRTSNPERFSFDLMYRLSVENILRALTLAKCPFDTATVYKCGDIRDPGNFDSVLKYLNGQVTSHTFSGNLADSSTQNTDFLMKTLSMSAGLEDINVQWQHTDISKTHTDVSINKIIALGVPQCAGECGIEKDGSEELAFVTDRDTSPTYAGAPAPYLGYSDDKGNTWTLTQIDDFLSADATDVIKVGNRLVLFSPNHPPSYVSLDNVRGTLSPTDFVASTGISANFPGYGAVTPNGTIYAAGVGGYIYKSTDGGFSFESVDAAVTTTNNLSEIAVATDDLIWIGGASGTLVKINRGVVSLVSVIDDTSATLTANITALAVADQRTNELHIGTASGTIWRSRNVNSTSPEFTLPGFENKGVGSVDVLAFNGWKGDQLWIIQSNASNQSRVLLDQSGGALGNDVKVIGSFTSPSNSLINSIVVIDSNNAYTVGEVDGSNGFIGRVSP